MEACVKYKGLWFDKPKKRWRVRLYNRKQIMYLKYFSVYELALRDYLEARAAHNVTRLKSVS